MTYRGRRDFPTEKFATKGDSLRKADTEDWMPCLLKGSELLCHGGILMP